MPTDGALPNREIRVGDCRALLRELPDESVNCVVTSPPYWGLRDYGVDGQIGLEETPEIYVARMVEVFREVRRVLRADGVAWVNLGDIYSNIGKWGGTTSGKHAKALHGPSVSTGGLLDRRGHRGERLANGRGDQAAILRRKTKDSAPPTQVRRLGGDGLKPKDLVGIPWMTAFALRGDGWYLRSDIVWHKANPMPESVQDRPTKAHEYVFLLSKSEKYFYDADAIREPQVAPEASTPSDVARAFSRRRATTIDPRQEAIGTPRKRSGNKTRAQRSEHGGARGRATNQSFGIPWEDTDGLRNKRSVWTIATEPYSGAHFATFPKKLVEPCILAGCPAGGLVLDPFGGSGTVGEVAEALGRRWMLLELNPAYAELARARTAQRGLFGDAAAAALTARNQGGGGFLVILSPITLKEARAFVARIHRHHRAPQGGLFAVAVAEDDTVHAVAIVGRPVARALADGFTAEVTRLASDGAANACSMLYGAAWRAARALGYRRLVTYTLAEERGTSLRAAGWRLVGEAGGGSWSRPNVGRARVDLHPTQGKLRWERAA